LNDIEIKSTVQTPETTKQKHEQTSSKTPQTNPANQAGKPGYKQINLSTWQENKRNYKPQETSSWNLRFLLSFFFSFSNFYSLSAAWDSIGFHLQLYLVTIWLKKNSEFLSSTQQQR
jgi:hypothetical protein